MIAKMALVDVNISSKADKPTRTKISEINIIKEKIEFASVLHSSIFLNNMEEFLLR